MSELWSVRGIRRGCADPDQRKWRVIPHLRELRDVAVSPRGFDHSTVPVETPGKPGHTRVPADPYRPEYGVLVTLDLDDVPRPPLRPAFVPGVVAVHGEDVWVADADLPVLLRLRRGRVSQNLMWPGGIGHGSLRLYPDDSGCWITGPDGVWRAEDDQIRRVSTTAPTDGTAALRSTVAVAVRDAQSDSTLHLVEASGSESVVDLPGVTVRSLTAHGDRFLLLLGERDTAPRPPDYDSRPWLAWVSPTGEVRHGDRLPYNPYLYRPVPGSVPAMLADDYTLNTVSEDLELEAADYLGRRPLATWAGDGYVAVCTHLPDATDTTWAPLTGPPEVPDGQPHWLLTELDPTTLDSRRTSLVPAVPDFVGRDSDNVLWTIARGLRRCTGDSGTPAEHIDVAAMLHADDAAVRPTPNWGWD